MRIHALNPKLQQLCVGVGLIERNTYYSLRRTAIIETRRKHGTEAAKDLAFHVASANSLFFYDNVGFGDVDMQQFRVGGADGMSREEVQKFFSQANLARWRSAQEQDQELSLQQVLDQKVKAQLQLHPEYIASELGLKDLYESIGNKLEELQSDGQIPNSEKIPAGYAARDGTKYRALAHKYQRQDLVNNIDEFLADRKRKYRAIRLRLRNEIRQEVRKEHKALVADSQRQAAQKFALGSFDPEHVRDLHVAGVGQSAQDMSFEDDGDGNISPDDDDVGGVDEEVLEDHDMGNREEPECWEE